jgi:UDP-N-acetylglucosamine--N-acetylmuramyl-(pentapeptide) pyrophosphoryl-undecaprenol N-acetylglucosamine transferase
VTAVSYPETATALSTKNTVVTGNVLRQQLVQKNPTQPAWVTFKPEKPLLYITGGSQGSEVINTVVCQSLPRILKDWYVIHQCGAANINRSYKQELESARGQLKAQLRFSYIVREWVSVEELAWIYKNAAGLVSRAGANTTQEVALFKIPSVMIPLPFSNHNEQLLNAQWLEETGGAIIIHQKDLVSEVLCDALDILKARSKAFSRKLEALEVPLDADKRLYELAQTHARS